MRAKRNCFIAVCMLLSAWPVLAQIASPAVLLKNVNVIGPDGKLQENVDIEIRGGRIAAIGKNLELQKNETAVDKSGKFVIPGLIDLRVQLGASPGNRITRAEVGEEQRIDWLHSLLKLGVTTARLIQSDMGEQTDLKRWRDRALLNGPDIIPSGATLTEQEGIPTMQYGLFAIETRLREVFEIKDTQSATEKAREIAHNGGKIFEIVFTTGPKAQQIPRLSEENLAIVTKEAHGHDLKAFCWVGFNDEAATAMAKGCDVLEGMTEEVLSDSVLKEMASKHIPFLPSLVSQGYLIDHYLQPEALKKFAADPLVKASLSPLMQKSLEADKGQIISLRQLLPVPGVTAAKDDEKAQQAELTKHALAQQEERSYENVRKAKAAGVSVITGTGAGGVLNFAGASEQIELRLLVEHGFTPLEALQCATANAAASLGRQEELGAVAVGKIADLVILDANPLQDIRNAAKINSVVRYGWVIDPSDMLRY